MAEVRAVDAELLLHDPGGQADLVTPHGVALRDAQPDALELDPVGVVDVGARVPTADRLHRDRALLRVPQLRGQPPDILFGE